MKKLGVAGCLGALLLSFLIVWAFRVANVKKIDNKYSELCQNSYCMVNYYDQYYAWGPFTDEVKATEYANELANDCDYDCQVKGC